MERRRIDTLLAERGLAGSRTSAADSVRAGRVRIGRDGPSGDQAQPARADDAELLVEEEPRYVSRGGLKLEHGLDDLGDRGRRALAAWTWAPPPAGSPTACCGGARRG